MRRFEYSTLDELTGGDRGEQRGYHELAFDRYVVEIHGEKSGKLFRFS